MIKESSVSGNNWNIWDTARSEYNPLDAQLRASTTAAENTSVFADYLSNGFKIRTSTTGRNLSGVTYIYAAFAENPFALNARAR